jgi:hypothetical protein
MPDLDDRLASSRAAVLDSITQPPLAAIRRRAAARRQRRAAAVAGGAVLAVAAATVLAVRPAAPAVPPTAPGAPAPADTASRPVYAADGITIDGLAGGDARPVPGRIAAVEFGDPAHGYLLTACATGESCRPTLYATSDAGRTWRERALPPWFSPDALIAFPGDRLVVESATDALVSADRGNDWRTVPRAVDPSARSTVGPGGVLRLGRTPDGCGGRLEVRGADDAARGQLASQPDLTVCWVAAAPASDGAWWVAGHRDGRAAVAVSRDAGRHWRTTTVDPAAGDRSRTTVAALGRHVWVAVTGDGGALRAIHHSGDGGRTFTVTRGADAAGAAPTQIAGDLVPLLDGRLLVAGRDHRWYVSRDDGATFTHADGSLPAVGSLVRTRTGYVARDLFNAGWAAYSPDGAHWRKLPLT